MLAEIGGILTGLSLAAAVYAAIAFFWAIQRDDPRWAASGRSSTYVAAGLLGFALLFLLAAFLTDQFQVSYVALHSNRDLPTYLKVSAVWAGQEGSLLLWAFLQALFAALVVARPSEHSRPLIPWTAVFLNVFTAFFAFVTLFLSNPFELLATAPADGLGLNPLLRHPGMVFHPPALYLGYVGLAIPFAFAMAALLTNRIEEWPSVARRWTLASWLFLGVGILLGARWAYDVLGWGGYWGWDPVENAGLMPWLTTTALLHGIAMQEQRDGFRRWNIALATLSFVLVLWGTFTTRSGWILSVHAFAESTLGAYYLAFMLLSLVGAAALMIYRHRSLADPNPSGALFSRNGMFFLAILLFLTFTATVFAGSLIPTITERLADYRQEAGPEWFDFRTAPQFAALILLLAICPLMGRAAGTLRRLGGRGWPALLGAALFLLYAVLAGFTRWFSLLGFAVIGLAAGTTLAEFVRDTAARVRSRGEGPLRALWGLFARNRRKYGGYLVHVGVILTALGIVGTRMYSVEAQAVLSPGEPQDVAGYTLVFEDIRREAVGDHFDTLASFSVYRDGAYLANLQPRIAQYTDQSVGVPALLTGLREDFYVVLSAYGQSGVTVKVFVNPLASFLWLGGLVLLSGGAVAVWPAARAAHLPVAGARQRAGPRRRTIGNVVGLAVGLLVLGAAGAAMWGPGHGVTMQRAGRPLPGQAAPDFTLDLLDDSTFALSESRGQVVVLNIWATWCPPCEEELPDLQAAWDAYRGQGVVFVGAAYQDQVTAVQQMAADFGITYPIGVDAGDRVAMAYGITGVPETFVINPAGRVAYVHIGPVTAMELAQELDALLNQ
ncbi:MAG: cytochrome c biogenesis protein CcsA [Anaerolineae bacterium]|nr:cytochrome c biogenesis protein CcsA [Anaerolineae bacterium]